MKEDSASEVELVYGEKGNSQNLSSLKTEPVVAALSPPPETNKPMDLMEKENHHSENKVAPKNFFSSVRDVELLFIKASESSKEVPRMLEANKFHFRPIFPGRENGSLLSSFLKACFSCGEDPSQVPEEEGQWLVTKPYSPLSKPGGHGVIWKLAHDKGVFKWFYRHGRKGATMRQVSNVVAATDLTLLALAGIGLHQGKKLGFASCKRILGATEGINVLIEKKSLDGNWSMVCPVLNTLSLTSLELLIDLLLKKGCIECGK